MTLPFPFRPPVRSLAVVTYQTSVAQEVITATNTFNGVSFGTASSDRYIIVGILARSGSTSTTISSVTIGGVAATAVTTLVIPGSGSGENLASIYIAAVPTGTTGTVTVVSNNSMARLAIVVWSATGLDSATAVATGTSSAAAPTASLAVRYGGFAVGVSYSQSTTSATWAGISENVDTTTNFSNTYTGASLGQFAAAQASLTMTATWASGTAPVGAFASFR